VQNVAEMEASAGIEPTSTPLQGAA